MDEPYIDRLRQKRKLKYRIRHVSFRVFQIVVILGAGYFGWTSRALIASFMVSANSTFTTLKQLIVSPGP